MPRAKLLKRSARHCRDAANTAKRSPFMFFHSFSDLAKAAFTHRVAKLRFRDGSKLPGPNRNNLPPGSGLTPCNTVNERPLPRAIWGKASPTQTRLTGMRTSPPWPHSGFQDFQI